MLQLVKGKSIGNCSASDHAEAEACPFFIRECNNLYRMLGIHFLLVHRLEGLDPSQHAQGAVEVPAVLDRVDVRSNQNHWSVWASSLAATDQISYGVLVD